MARHGVFPAAAARAVLIRDADSRRDAGACAAIYAPYVRDTAISFEDEPPTPEAMAGRMDEMTRTHPWLVAEVGDEVVAYAYASRHRDRATYRWAADVAIYVAAQSQRGGVGRALYEALFELLADQGLRVACAGITLPNPASVGLHEALGFTPVGVYRKIGYKLGAWHDVGWWQLELAPHDGGGPPREPGPPIRLGARAG